MMTNLFKDDLPSASTARPINDEIANDIYQQYPKHVGKKAAIKAIKNACRDMLKEGNEDPVQALLDATRAYRRAVMTWPESDKRFIKHPSSWFNQGHYEDDPDEWYQGERKRPAPTNKILSGWEDKIKAGINAVQQAKEGRNRHLAQADLRADINRLTPRLRCEPAIAAIVEHAEALL